MIHRPLILIAALLTLAVAPSVASALDWHVLPNDAWAGDAGVNVEYSYAQGSASGPVIGAAAVMIGPLLQGVERPIAADQFVGRGETVCLVANAVRGDIRSPAVSDCYTFLLGAPALLAPR